MSDIAKKYNKMKVSNWAPLERTCDICKREQAVIDAPSSHGAWGYFCKKCIKSNNQLSAAWDLLGTRIVSENWEEIQ